MSTLNNIIESSLRMWPYYLVFGFALVAGVLVARKSRPACILLICGAVLSILHLMWLYLCVAYIKYNARVNGSGTIIDGISNQEFIGFTTMLLHGMGATCLVLAAVVGRKKSQGGS